MAPPPPSITYQNAYLIVEDKVAGSDLGGPFIVTETVSSSTLEANENVQISGTGSPGASGTFTGLRTEIGGVNYPLIDIGGQKYLFTDQALTITGSNLSLSFGAIPICFGPDVLISTPKGACRVDALRVGDDVATPAGPQRVKFVGRSTRFLPELRATGRLPVVIQAGALGVCRPTQDLICTPSHAFLMEGVLAEAQALLNGHTIRQLDSLDSFEYTYYSIELDHHALVWANGVLSETYFANVRDGAFTRVAWDNYSDYVALYGEGGSMREMELPRIPFARQLPPAVMNLISTPARELQYR
jgi:hypothetical protein